MMVSEKVIWAAMLKIIGLLLDLKPFQIIEWDSQKCYLNKPPSVVVIFDLLFILDALHLLHIVREGTLSYFINEQHFYYIKKNYIAPPGFEPVTICVWVLNANHYATVDLLDTGLKIAIYVHTNFRQGTSEKT